MLTRPGQALGSMDYMAPEQIRGEEVTAQSDVYALGCVMIECLSGRRRSRTARGCAFSGPICRRTRPTRPPAETTCRADVGWAITARAREGAGETTAHRDGLCAYGAHRGPWHELTVKLGGLEVTDLIFVEQKPMEGREQTLEPGATIGREGCEVNLMDPEVSRRHATIRDQGGIARHRGPRLHQRHVRERRANLVGDRPEGRRRGAPREHGLGDSLHGAGQRRAPVRPASATFRPERRRSPPLGRYRPTSRRPPRPRLRRRPRRRCPPQRRPRRRLPSRPRPALHRWGAAATSRQPPEVVPSAIRRVVLPPTPGQAPVFQNPGSRPGGSAATRLDATVICMIIVAATAAALVIYFITV